MVLIAKCHYKYELEHARHIKEAILQARFVGSFASEKPELFLEVADFVVKGEIETAYYILKNKNIRLSGLLEDGSSSFDFVNLPMPNWDGFDISQFGYFPALPKKPFLTIQGSRGCPFGCEFCPYIVSQGIPLRRRENSSIIAEIRYLVDKYRIKSLLFRDITWSMDIEASKQLCRLIIDQDFSLEIGVETRIDRLDNELIDLMSQAGVKVVNLGIESPDPKIVFKSGRTPIKNSQMFKTIKYLEKKRIQIQAFYILGLLDDTHESIQKTIKYSQFLNTYTLNIAF